MSWMARLILATCTVIAGLLAWGVLARYLAPVSNTSRTRFDAIIVLGYPADRDGNPTPTQLSRVNEAVREYERGIAPRIIVSGGATRYNFVEAKVMARTAQAEGIPASAIFIEDQAKDTIQNACYSARIMKSHGWHSAEVVSNPSHLPRAGLIFERLPIEWRVHAAPSLEPRNGPVIEALLGSLETLKTVRYLIWSSHMEQCQP
jgi:uncharacterized SAM-binding protein YcdF (DUF218 family)